MTCSRLVLCRLLNRNSLFKKISLHEKVWNFNLCVFCFQEKNLNQWSKCDLKGFCHAIYWKWKEIRTEEEVKELFLGGEDQINWVIGTLDESKLWAQCQNSLPKTLLPSSSQICKYLFMPHTSLFLFLCQNRPFSIFVCQLLSKGNLRICWVQKPPPIFDGAFPKLHPLA